MDDNYEKANKALFTYAAQKICQRRSYNNSDRIPNTLEQSNKVVPYGTSINLNDEPQVTGSPHTAIIIRTLGWRPFPFPFGVGSTCVGFGGLGLTTDAPAPGASSAD